MRSFILAAALALLAAHATAQTPDTVFIEELTWTEVRDAIKAGKTTVILPTGGTEQNGPHMVLGKHNFIIKYTSEQIARKLGNALVAPVVAYVPEGNLNPPSGHMRYPGAITLPNEYFMKLVEYAARSFKVNGFTDIVFIGDSGGNQDGMRQVAELLKRGYSDADVKKILGQNVLRALRRAEEVAARLQKEREPSTATIEKLDGTTTSAGR